MDAFGVVIILVALLLILLGITNQAENVLNGVRGKTGNPMKAVAP